MKIIVTCGPSFEPIDEVRRLTNFSTGELGTQLSQVLAEAGHEVICLRGQGTSCSSQPPGTRLQTFTTNEDLAHQLESLAVTTAIDVFFHTAALSDFQVAAVRDANGTLIHSRKIPSRQERITLELTPAMKVIHRLRSWFPQARIVGWKYELEGNPEDLLARGQRQITEGHTQACVLNGRAYGPGFGFYQPGHPLQHLDSKAALCQFLTKWVG